MSPDSCSYLAHLLIPRETLTPLTVTFALAIKEKTTIKSQNTVAVVQTFKEITGDIMGVISDKSLYG